MSVQGALFTENVGTMWADDALYFVVSSHVGRQIRRLLATLGTWQVLKSGDVHLQPVDVQGGFRGKLLVAVGTLFD